MAFQHGSKAVLKVQNAAGVLTDITQYVQTDGLARTADTAETTTHGKTSKTYLPGLKDGTISLEGNYDPVVDAMLDGILGMERTFEWYPQGTTSGLPKYSGSAILTSYEAETPVDDKGSITGELQCTGDIVRGTAA